MAQAPGDKVTLAPVGRFPVRELIDVNRTNATLEYGILRITAAKASQTPQARVQAA